ncbi:MAG: MobF family relaxase, partial [bacterium]
QMEAEVQTRVRMGGTDFDRTTGNMIWADFEHSTSRQVAGQAPDPHRHIHCVCMNLTFDPVENRFKAAQFGDVMRDAPYWEAVFESRLAAKIKSLGYEIERNEGRNWEIAGIPRSVITKFSKRTEEIETEAERLGITDPKQKAELGAKTRASKMTGLSPQELRKEWESQLTPDERQAINTVHRRDQPNSTEITPVEAVQFAIHHCFERKAVVPERELIRTALYYGIGSLSAEEVARELPHQGVLLREHHGRMMATTSEVYAEERFITQFARSQRGTVPPVRLVGQLSQGQLDNEHWQTVKKLLQSQNRVNLIDASAGTGKTTLLKAFDQAMRIANQKVFYLATTTQAVDVLRRDGFEAETVARFLESSTMQNQARDGRIVVDEASLMGNREAYRLFKIAQSENLRIDLVGDSAQHGSVTRGSLMNLLKKHAGIEPFRLSRLKRQKNPEYRQVVSCFAQGQTLEGFDRLERMGWIKEVDGMERYEILARDYADRLEETGRWRDLLVVSPTHAELETVTESIRHELKERGQIEREEIYFDRLDPANLTEAERRDTRNYEAKHIDLIQFHRSAKGFSAGTRMKIDEHPETVPTPLADRFQAYRVESIPIAKGDLIRFTLGGKTLDGNHQIRNGSTYKVAGFTEKGDLTLENGWVVAKDYGHFRHGYVETSFGSQG